MKYLALLLLLFMSCSQAQKCKVFHCVGQYSPRLDAMLSICGCPEDVHEYLKKHAHDPDIDPPLKDI